MIRFKKRCNWFASAGLMLALLLAVSLVTPALAQPPGLPHQFYGTVTVNGAAATPGATVAAYLNGALNASTTVDSQGRYGYSPIFTLTGSGGETVTFFVGGTQAGQTYTFAAGGITRLDLTVTTTTLSVSTNPATSIGSSTATLNGNLTNMGGFTSVNVSFQYGTTLSYGSTTPTQARTTTGAFTAALTGLTPSTTYYFRAVAQSGTTTVYGTPLSFSTSAAVLSVTTVGSASVTASGATLNGDLTDRGPNSSVNVYFRYGSSGSMTSSTPTQARTTTGAFTATLTGLMPNTTYYFQAVAVGATTVYGSIMTFNTSVGTLGVTTGSATSISASGATLNGTLTGLGTNSSVSVRLNYGPTASYGSSTSTQIMTAPGAFSATISGLTASTAYHFQAVAVGSTTVTGSDASFTTTSSIGGTSPPHQFYGYVYVSGTLAPSGTTVAAYVNGSPAASTTANSSGKYGYTTLFLVPGTSGGTVTFYVGGTLVPQTATWSSGGMSWLNLYSAQTALTVTCSATYATATTATLSGTVTSFGPGDTSAAVSFEWGTSPSSLTTVTASPSTVTAAGQSFTATKTALTAGTTYYYKAKAVGNASGTVYCPTSGTNQYTHNPSGSLAVTTNSATTGDTTATLNGNLTSLGTDTSATLSFEWGTTMSYGSTAAGTPSSLTVPGAFTASLTVLTNGTTYHCRAKAVGSPSGSTVYGSDVTFTPSIGGSKLIGADDATATANQYSNYFILDSWAATNTGNVTQIRIKCGASGNVKVAIYADNAGQPGPLLNAVNTSTPVTTGWNTINITSTAITSGTNYWLAFISDSYCVSYVTSYGRNRVYREVSYGTFTFPNPAGSGFFSYAGAYNLIAGY